LSYESTLFKAQEIGPFFSLTRVLVFVTEFEKS
jgi:hypothetical protein